MAGTYLLPDVVGAAHARDLLLTGRVVDADEALRLGLVSRVIEPATFLDEVLADRGRDRRHRADREPADQARAAPTAGTPTSRACLQWEAMAQPITLATADLQEGIRAAREKRPPVFTGAEPPDVEEAPGRLRTLAFPLRVSVDGPGASSGLDARSSADAGQRGGHQPVDNAVDNPVDERRHRWRTASGRERLWRTRPGGRRTLPLTSTNGSSTGCGGRTTSREEHGVSERPTAYDGGPVAALRRIAFLLERGREDTYKVKAFRGAAAAILPLSEEEVAAAVEDGTLTDLPGVGASSAQVIADAVAASCPSGSPTLEREHGGPLTAGGHELRAALRGDLHSHSDWSDGGSPIEEMAFTAIELGHDYLVLTDHSPRLTVAHGLSAERLTRQLGVVDAVNEHLAGAGFTLLKGIEVDILDDGALDQDDELLARLDVRVASVHSKLKMDAAAMTRRMIGAVRNPRTNVLGHCTGRLVTGNRGTPAASQFDARAVFEACAEHDVAVEINSRPERRDPPTKLLELARDIGCLFSIDSDAHAPGAARLPGLRLRAGRAGRASTPTGSSTPGRRSACWPGRTARFAPMSAGPRWRYAARSGAAVPSRRTATATGSS